MKTLFLLLLLPFTINGIYAQSDKANKSSTKKIKVKGDWKTLTQANYSIQYPPTWELNQDAWMGTSFVFLSPLETKEDQFMENVNLIIQDLEDKSIDLNKYTQISEDQIKTMITNGNLIESKRLKSGSNDYQKIIYSANQGDLQLKYEQYYWVINDKAYILTFTAKQSTFDRYQDIGEKILSSFKFNK